MSESLVIDTNILIHAASDESDEETYSVALFIVGNILEDDSIKLAIDNNYEILDEYKNNLKEHDSRVSDMLEEFIQKQIYKRRGEERIAVHIPIRKREVRHLIEEGFDKSDIKFVRIAPKTDLKTIATTDGRSFLEDGYKEWINNELNVDIKDINEFRDFLIDR